MVSSQNYPNFLAIPVPVVIPLGAPGKAGAECAGTMAGEVRLDYDVRLVQNLTDGPLMSARSRGGRRRVGVAADHIMIDEKYRVVIPHVMVLDHGHAAIVQHEPGSIEPGRNNRVIFFPDVVPQDDNPKVIRGNSRLLQSNELCNRVIFAVSGTPGERVEGRTPDVLDTVKRQI